MVRPLLFRVVSNWHEGPGAALPVVLLVIDHWNDWFVYQTMFQMVVYDENGNRVEAGEVKIGMDGLTAGRPPLPDTFDELDPSFFSVGQGQNYYESLGTLRPDLRRKILVGLRDLAFNPHLFHSVKDQPVVRRSLLRSVNASSVSGVFNQIAHGSTERALFNFSYRFPGLGSNLEMPSPLSFKVVPESSPPTNIHVLIGRNGVGKTRTLTFMTHSLMGLPGPENEDPGEVVADDGTTGRIFANLVSVSFSAFDPFNPLPPDTLGPSSLRYAYVGLKQSQKLSYARGAEASLVDAHLPLKTQNDLASEFVASVAAVRKGPRLTRWRAALDTLESDELFKEADVSSLADPEDMNWADRADLLFRRLSSGHGAILLTTTRLVELVDDRTLVLLDEPEGHLHPPLLSAFIRVLSDLLIERNGVAIVATHSPVVLQEVPKSCVWILTRFGAVREAVRPEIETFGENVGALTREVFGLEVMRSGFHKLISRAIESGSSYEQILDQFGGQLGAEGRSIARALVIARSATSTDGQQ